MSIHLEAKHLDIVRKILHQFLPDRTVLVFGSRVTGQYKPHSDLPVPVDLVDWATTDVLFQEIIKKNRVILEH